MTTTPGVTGPLTASKIATLKPRADRYEIADAAAPGLRLRVYPSGARVFRWHVRDAAGRQEVITLGPWAPTSTAQHLTLAEARVELERLKAARAGGRLSGAREELDARMGRAAPAPTAAGPVTVADVAGAFRAHLRRTRKRPEQGERPLDADILPALGSIPIADVTPRHCRQVVEAVVARGSPRQAGVVLQILRQLMTFAVARADIQISPAAALTSPAALGVENNLSQRYLADAEIAALWAALDAYPGLTPTVRAGIRVLLLTGARSGELLRARVADVDLEAKTWTVPVEHQKLARGAERHARPWVVPLAPAALELMRELVVLAGSLRSPWLMASFSAASPGAPLTEKALAHAMRRIYTRIPFVGERPTPHDLRRTVRTHLGMLGVQHHVAERCLNHSLGRIAATYDVGDYLPERRAALELWDAHVSQLSTSSAHQ